MSGSQSRAVLLAPLLFLLLVVVLAAAWKLTNLLLLVFGAVLVALLFNACSSALSRWTGVSYRISLTIVVILITLLIAGFMAMLGSQIASEMNSLIKKAPQMISAAGDYFDITDSEEWIKNRLEDMIGQRSLVGDLTGISTVLLSVPVNMFLVAIGGIYFAADPKVYNQGFLNLLPQRHRARISNGMSAVADALRRWFFGQLLSMICIGVLTTIGLMALGISSPFALGFIAGVLEFIPYIGPVLSAVPAVAVAFGNGPWDALWVVVLYTAIQQAESAFLVPIIQKKTVKLPPGLTVFTILAFGILLGPVGMIFGAPLTVVSFVLVQKFWKEDVIENEQPH
ncbi:AI-2E family transporter [Rhizobium sp. L1K21]|uniref:AI-2E family transporter n=1 Tax=Rhizobium sp. L1K21 TaxID=2954933 RepID=UPI002093936F|nr:AI-2E family transporter [Rhizobium sp. L1K21]